MTIIYRGVRVAPKKSAKNKTRSERVYRGVKVS